MPPKRKSESKAKILSDEQVPEDSDEGLSGSEAKPAKKAKTVAKQDDDEDAEEEETAGSLQEDAEGGMYAELGKKKRVTVRSYKKAILIDFREFYADKATGQDKPGKKGLSISPENWEELKKLIPAIDAQVEKLEKGAKK